MCFTKHSFLSRPRFPLLILTKPLIETTAFNTAPTRTINIPPQPNSFQSTTNRQPKPKPKHTNPIPIPKCANTTPPPTTAAQLLPPLGHSATEVWSCDAQLSTKFRSRASLLNRDSVGFVLSVRLLGRQEGIFGLPETVWGRLRGRKGFGLRGIGCLHWKGSLTSSLRVIVCRRRKS